MKNKQQRGRKVDSVGILDLEAREGLTGKTVFFYVNSSWFTIIFKVINYFTIL